MQKLLASDIFVNQSKNQDENFGSSFTSKY